MSADDDAVGGIFGAAGGQLTATGPDATTYTLTLPANALPEGTPITMVPYSDVTGIPGATAPAHRLGVALYPEGLQLSTPGMLTITPPGSAPLENIATLSSAGDGKDAAMVLHSVKGSALTISIPHFSGWVATWPVELSTVQVVIDSFIADSQRELQAAVAEVLAMQRQQQLLGNNEAALLPAGFLDELVRKYDSEVLEPLLLNAASGCAQSTRALVAYISYARTMQLLGLADDPRYERPIPDSLLQTQWGLCSNEEFQRCSQTGDFPHLETFLLFVARQQELLGNELPADWEAEGTDYLQRCGQWRLHIDTDSNIENVLIVDASRDITLQWKAGTGPFHLFGSTIAGAVAVKVTTMQQGVAISDPQPSADATAEIKSLSFDEHDAPVGPMALPTPRDLSVEVNLGDATYHTVVGNGSDNPADETTSIEPTIYRENFLDAVAAIDPDHKLFPNPGKGPLTGTIEKGWQYDDNPYRAHLVKSDTVTGSFGRLEVLVVHSPQ